MMIQCSFWVNYPFNWNLNFKWCNHIVHTVNQRFPLPVVWHLLANNSGIILNLICYATLFYTISVLCTTIGLWIVFNVPRSTDTNVKLTSSCSHAILSYRYRFPNYSVQECNWRLFETGLSGQDCPLFMWPCDCGSKGIGNDAIFDGVDYFMVSIGRSK